MLEQTRITFQPQKRDTYVKETIKQPGALFPWTVKIEGWLISGLDVKIEHDELKNGYMYFSNLKFRNARHFSSFVAKIIDTFKVSFNKNMYVSGNDLLALMEGYEKGKKKARSCYISCSKN